MTKRICPSFCLWMAVTIVFCSCSAGARLSGKRAFDAYRRVVGHSVEGAPIECTVLGNGADVALLMASIHGSESAGTALLRILASYLFKHPEALEGRTVVLLPEANPDGVAARSRLNARGVDLNRNFEAPNWVNLRRYGTGPLSEPEARAIWSVIAEYRPARIVTLHEPLACIDYDGPAEALARRMAAECDLPVRKLGAMPGSVGSYAGEVLGIPIVTVELPKNASEMSVRERWKRYGPMLLAAVANCG